MAIYYCSDADIINILSASLTDSPIEEEAARNTILRAPAKGWVDSVYPDIAPFPGVSLAEGYQVNQDDHAGGDTTVAIDGGSGTPAAGEQFYAFGDKQGYTITDYSGGVLTYTPAAKTAFSDDRPIMIGTPTLVRLAATWFAVSIAYNIHRDNPDNEASAAALRQAKGLLRVNQRSGMAKARPWVGYPANTIDDAPILEKI